MDKAIALTGQTPVVSKLRSNQLVCARSQSAIRLSGYFARQKDVNLPMNTKGGQTRHMTMLVASLLKPARSVVLSWH